MDGLFRDESYAKTTLKKQKIDQDMAKDNYEENLKKL